MSVEQFGGLAGRVVARLAKHIETTVAGLDLSLAQYRVLGWLREGATASSSLAERMAVTRPSISSLVDGLVARGLVERLSDPDDRRRQPVVLTSAGERLLAQANHRVGERLQQVLGELDDRKAGTVRTAVDHLRLALDADRERRRTQQKATATP